MRTCENCTNEIENIRADAIYCSDLCGNRARNRRYYTKNTEKVLANRRLNALNIQQRILSRIKSRAKKKNIPFDLEKDDIQVPTHCPILGLLLILSNQGSGYHVDSPSVDRIDPTLGYMKGNVRVISARANLLKNNASSHELQLVVDDLIRLGQ